MYGLQRFSWLGWLGGLARSDRLRCFGRIADQGFRVPAARSIARLPSVAAAAAAITFILVTTLRVVTAPRTLRGLFDGTTAERWKMCGETLHLFVLGERRGGGPA